MVVFEERYSGKGLKIMGYVVIIYINNRFLSNKSNKVCVVENGGVTYNKAYYIVLLFCITIICFEDQSFFIIIIFHIEYSLSVSIQYLKKKKKNYKCSTHLKNIYEIILKNIYETRIYIWYISYHR